MGFEYAASTPPVCTSSTTTLPRLPAERERGRALRDLRHREHDGADRLLVRERVGEVVHLQLERAALEVGRVRVLDADRTVLDRLVADDVGEQ